MLLSAALDRIKTDLKARNRYDNFIGGEWVAPVKGQYFENITPITGGVYNEIARSTAADIELALDAAHRAKDAWGKTSVAARRFAQPHRRPRRTKLGSVRRRRND